MKTLKMLVVLVGFSLLGYLLFFQGITPAISEPVGFTFTPTSTNTATSTSTSTATSTATSTPTPTFTDIPSATFTPTPTSTQTMTSTATYTPTSTQTSTPTVPLPPATSPTFTPTPTATGDIPEVTLTPTIVNPGPTATPTATATSTSIPTITLTPLSPTPTATSQPAVPGATATTAPRLPSTGGRPLSANYEPSARSAGNPSAAFSNYFKLYGPENRLSGPLTAIPLGQSELVKVIIPKLNVNAYVQTVRFDGVTWDVSKLTSDLGWLENTSLPDAGGNTVLAGHVTLMDGRRGPFFELQSLPEGAMIYLFTDQKMYTYKAAGHLTVLPGDINVLKMDGGKSRLTLLTCTDWSEAQKTYQRRIAVLAELVSVQKINDYTSH